MILILLSLVNSVHALTSGRIFWRVMTRRKMWIGKGVNIREFMRPFRGSYMGVNYDSTDPPSRAFKNHHSRKQFSQFVTETLLQRIETGAIRVWGRVGDVSPPPLGPPNDNRTAEAQIMH